LASDGRRAFGVRAQILLGLALVTLFAVLSTGYLALWAAGGTLRAQRESSALSLASSAAAAIAAVVDGEHPIEAPENRSRLQATVQKLGEHGEVSQVSVSAPNADVVTSRPPRLPEDVDSPLLVAALAGTPGAFNYRPDVQGRMDLLAYAPIVVRDRVMGAVRVKVPAPPPVGAVLDRSGWLLAALAVADALLVLALGFFVITQLVVRPLRDMQKATTRVSAGEWEQHIAPSGPREIAALSAAFNQMTSSLVAQREQLIRTEKLASVGQLAAGVAHEIGNPLAAVLGYVDILRLDADAASSGSPATAPASLSPADRLDSLNRVKAETQRIHRIIQDLLAYSRPSREEAQATAPLAVFETAKALLVPQARFRGVTMTVSTTAGGLPACPDVLASPGRLTQVFVNLLLNAADAMNGAGAIDVSFAATDDRVAITVADAGPGIPVDLRRKVFDPFFTTKAPGHGTGLGLSISRSIVESYGGTLELAPVESHRAGAAFVISLPRAART
jgi:signal transduction histidine kinase